MHLDEIDDVFDDDYQEIIDIIEMQRIYTVKEGTDQFNNLEDEEFVRGFGSIFHIQQIFEL